MSTTTTEESVPLQVSTYTEDPILNHILDYVLLLPDDSVIWVGLQHFGINDIYDLMTVIPRTDLVDEFIYAQPGQQGGFLCKIDNKTWCNIELLQEWAAQEQLEYQCSFEDIFWDSLDYHQFRQYAIQSSFNCNVKKEMIPDIPLLPVKTEIKTEETTSTAFGKELEIFQRSIKCSPSDYNKLKMIVIGNNGIEIWKPQSIVMD